MSSPERDTIPARRASDGDDRGSDVSDGFDERWDAADFTAAGLTHRVFRRGTGPGVVLVPEIPGATPEVIGLADLLVEAGFRVAVPSIIGTPGRPATGGYLAASALRMCVSREFAAFARRADRPVTSYLRALARDLHTESGGAGVGMIGMCFSGGFALAAAVEPAVIAPVLSQPALPPAFGAGAHATGLTEAAEATLATRVRDEGLCALGLRFTADRSVPASRFAAFERALGEGWRAFEIDSSAGNPDGIPTSAHSVLTDPHAGEAGHPTHAAWAAVIDFLRQRLAA
jgi:dienelactone hydrolase